jgi:hypothetical protein
MLDVVTKREYCLKIMLTIIKSIVYVSISELLLDMPFGLGVRLDVSPFNGNQTCILQARDIEAFTKKFIYPTS